MSHFCLLSVDNSFVKNTFSWTSVLWLSRHSQGNRSSTSGKGPVYKRSRFLFVLVQVLSLYVIHIVNVTFSVLRHVFVERKKERRKGRRWVGSGEIPVQERVGNTLYTQPEWSKDQEKSITFLEFYKIGVLIKVKPLILRVRTRYQFRLLRWISLIPCSYTSGEEIKGWLSQRNLVSSGREATRGTFYPLSERLRPSYPLPIPTSPSLQSPSRRHDPRQD